MKAKRQASDAKEALHGRQPMFYMFLENSKKSNIHKFQPKLGEVLIVQYIVRNKFGVQSKPRCMLVLGALNKTFHHIASN